MYRIRIGANGRLPYLKGHAAQKRRRMRSHVLSERWGWHLCYCSGLGMAIDVRIGPGRLPMPNEKNDQSDKNKRKMPFSSHTQERYPEVEPILDPTCGFEEVDRGEGMGVDDEKTYHRTEK